MHHDNLTVQATKTSLTCHSLTQIRNTSNKHKETQLSFDLVDLSEGEIRERIIKQTLKYTEKISMVPVQG